MSNGGKSFAALGATEQDKILADFEQNIKAGDSSASAAFFEMVRRHTLEGMFGDPSYGGNANFAGWNLIGYPGRRTYVPPQMQTMDATISPSRVSAKQLVHGSHYATQNRCGRDWPGRGGRTRRASTSARRIANRGT